MPGAGLTPDNIKDIHRRVKAKEYYSTLSKAFESLMLYRRKCVYMSGLPEVPEYSWNQTLPEVIRAFLDELK
jgi:copper homeostasis protein CutC